MLPSGGCLGLVCSVGLHLDLHHLEGVDDDSLGDPRAQAGQGVGLNTAEHYCHDIRPGFEPTRAPGLSAPNRKTFWNCSKVKNFQALFGVSTRTGGRRPFQKEKSPSWKQKNICYYCENICTYCYLCVHLPDTVPDPGVLGGGGGLELEPGLDEVQGVHDAHLNTAYTSYKHTSCGEGL